MISDRYRMKEYSWNDFHMMEKTAQIPWDL